MKLSDGASLDYVTTQDAISAQHYAFLVSEEVFESLNSKIRERKIQHWADPFGHQENQINTHDGGRGVYFQDPSGHYYGGHHGSVRRAVMPWHWPHSFGPQ
ncbi:hypothetical protein HJC10_17215 [Corallococcus exiguus]|nr:hypothetical protein [Corallococcus exiguus]